MSRRNVKVFHLVESIDRKQNSIARVKFVPNDIIPAFGAYMH